MLVVVHAVEDASPFFAGVVVVQAVPFPADAVEAPTLDSGSAVVAVVDSDRQCIGVVVVVVEVPPVVASAVAAEDGAAAESDGTERNCFAVHAAAAAAAAGVVAAADVVDRPVFLDEALAVVAEVAAVAGALPDAHTLPAAGHVPKEECN